MTPKGTTRSENELEKRLTDEMEKGYIHIGKSSEVRYNIGGYKGVNYDARDEERIYEARRCGRR